MNRMIASIGLAVFVLAGHGSVVHAQQDDEIIRLPGQGELRPELRRADEDLARVGRLIPGGGLLLSFDTNSDGAVDQAELAVGIEDAFRLADRNGSGGLSRFEQIDWAKQLPTRDPSLANPVRFDPNLDGQVTLSEFSRVIETFASDLASPDTGLVYVRDLEDTSRPARLNIPPVLPANEGRRRERSSGS